MRNLMLQDLLRKYKESGEGKQDVINTIGARMYNSYGLYGFECCDDAADAFIKYYGRISKMIDRYEEKGATFETYLGSTLRFLAKTVYRDKKKQHEWEKACARSVSDDYQAEEEKIESMEIKSDCGENVCKYGIEDTQAGSELDEGGLLLADSSSVQSRMPKNTQRAFRDRLVFLALKCAHHLDDRMIVRIAFEAHLTVSRMTALITEARNFMKRENDRKDSMIKRRNAAWCKSRIMEARIALEPDAIKRQQNVCALGKEKLRCAKLFSEIKLMRCLVPNSVIAKILQVPKGTVDSGLYYLRKMFSEIE